MNIIVYETEVDGSKKFLAHVDLGNDIYMSFFGAYKLQAVERAENWYARERARQLKLEAGCPHVTATGENLTGDNSRASGLINSGKGAHLRGMAWMIHEVTREKIRVPVAEVESYVIKGYFKGGTRSK